MAENINLGAMMGNSGVDSTMIPAQLRAMMAKRKLMGKDDEANKKITVLDDIEAIKKGVKSKEGYDTAMVKMNHESWLKHIDNMGYELKKKQ